MQRDAALGTKPGGTSKGTAGALAAHPVFCSVKSPWDTLALLSPGPPRVTPPVPLILTGVTVGTEVAMAAAALAGSHAHLILLAGEVSFADGWTDNSMHEDTARAQRQHLLASGTKCHQACPCCPCPPPCRTGDREHGGTPGAAELRHCTRPCKQRRALAAQTGRLVGATTRKMPPASCHRTQAPALPPASCHPAQPHSCCGCSQRQHPSLSSTSPAGPEAGRMWDVGRGGCPQPPAEAPPPRRLQQGHCHPCALLPSRAGPQPPKACKSLSCQGEWVLGQGQDVLLPPRASRHGQTPPSP